MTHIFMKIMSGVMACLLLAACAPPNQYRHELDGAGIAQGNRPPVNPLAYSGCMCSPPPSANMMTARSAPAGMVFTLEDVLFDTDKAALRPRGWEVIKVVSQHMATNPAYNAVVEGHTDNQGSDGYNIALSKRRAEGVRNALTSLGIPITRIGIRYFGEHQPRADNRTEQGRQANRRVHIILQ